MIISRPVSGKIRSYRTIVQIFLLGIFIVSPWIEMPSGTPFIRLDIPARRFHFLGNFYIPQEGIILFLFLLTMGLSLFFFTALIGRVWCGWACPQTIYTDVFDFFGRLVLGKKYGKADAPKAGIVAVHSVWIFVSLFASFHWIAYFAGPYKMIGDLLTFHIAGESYPYFLGFFTVAMYLDMGYVREQFCKYGCPYARFQTILMDEHSYNITYDYKRGEPRRNKKEKIGDCVSCNMCLVVCPTGIDIREGMQIGCIACGKCADACTITMAKENKKTLIDYFSLNQVATQDKKIQWIRPRTLLYGTLLTIVVSTAVFKLVTRIPLSVKTLADPTIEPSYIDKDTLRQMYKIKLYNISYSTQNLQFKAFTEDGNRELVVRTGIEGNIYKVESGEVLDERIMLELNIKEDEKLLKSVPVVIQVVDTGNPSIHVEKKIPLSIPLTKN